MTVKISFRTEFQDIPKDIKMLVEDVRNSLQAISGSKLQYVTDALRQSQDPSKIAEIVAMLETVREQLSKVEARTEDCISVLTQFHELSTAPAPQPSVEPEPEGE